MSKYLIFGWSNHPLGEGEADEFLGTSDHIATLDAIRSVEEPVKLCSNILQGRETEMTVLYNRFSKKRVLAYLQR